MTPIKTILICQYPLPYLKIASWTTMYNHYLRSGNHPFDYIVCPKGEEEIPNVVYANFTPASSIDKIKNKFDNKSRFNPYFEVLDAIIKPNNKYVIHIIDHSGIIAPLNDFISEKYNRTNFYVQYYYQGFDIIFKDENYECMRG